MKWLGPGNALGFIGAGNMAEAMINGISRSGLFAPADIWASDVKQERLDALSQAYKINTTLNNVELIDRVNIVVLSVKPQQLDDLLRGLGNTFSRHVAANSHAKMILSIAAGYPIRRIEKYLFEGLDEAVIAQLPIIRVMPNTPALALAGVSGMSGNRYATTQDTAGARRILEALGKVVELNEIAMDAVTAMSGSGPAYVYYLIEAFMAAGEKLGLSSEQCMTLTIETIKGALKLMEMTGEAPVALRAKVTSKGGTTEAAVAVLEKNGVKNSLVEAICAAARRSKEMSNA